MNPLRLTIIIVLITLARLSAEVRINEFLASNATGLTTAAGAHEDWIEIYNAGPGSVDLEGYYLTDSTDFSPETPESFWRFPQITLDPDSYLVVFASGSGESIEGEWHANFKISSGGERLALIAPDGVTALTDFSPGFPEQESGVSYGYNDAGEWVFMLNTTPGSVNRAGVSGFVEDVQFSVEHGFYEEAFTLSLSTATEGAEIMYTLDDREPDPGTLFTGPIGETYTGPIEISKTTVVRAVAKKKGLQDSALRTRTYLFLADVMRQADVPEGFPERWGTRPSDYEMDPEVVGPIYSEEEVIAALRSAPTISLVTENDHLFSRDGIYTNSQAKDLVNDGVEDAWERPVSVEFFGFPHGQTVQANAGIRMQGNASRSPNRVKHNMRVIFRRHYGPGKMRFRLFEDSEVETFNSINLRSNNGDSWIHPGVRLRAQYIRDQWHREVQRRMAQPNQSQIYAHVYINGLYWGMYHVFERFEASLLSEHFGGDEDDWDALQDTPAFQDIVVNGSDDAYRLTHSLAKEDLTVQENYDELLKYVDVDNQIDYLLINFYSGNQDWDHKNMRYGRRRTPVEGAQGNGWMYFAWDSERAGLNGLNTQSLTMDNTNKRTALGPSLLNAEMHDNPDYHLRFADRVVKHLFNGGELTPEGAAESWNDLADLVYQPLIGESARWGDLHVSTPETREGNWQKQLDKENEVWFPGRTDVLLDQLATRGFIPRKITFPKLKPHGGVVSEGTTVTMRIFNDTIFNPVSGDVHYTMNGADPRLPDGSLHPEAIPYDSASPPVIDQAVTIMARVHDPDGDWSPLSEVDFYLAAPADEKTLLVISELHYAPAPATPAEEAAGYEASSFEFIELKNVADHAIDLSGVQFTRGVTAVVADAPHSVLAPGEHAVLVANEEAFKLRYPQVDPLRIVGVFAEESNLDSNGERVSVRDRHGVLLHTLRYDDREPWPVWNEGAGHSLVYVGGAGESIAHPGNWSAGEVGGSPGAANSSDTTPPDPGESDVNLDDWLADHDLAQPMDSPTGVEGVPALLYYAFGVDDFGGGDHALAPTIRYEADRGVVLSHSRRVGATDITWALESSDDLQSWSDVVAESQVADTVDQVETVEIVTPGVAGYWRLRVTVK